MLEGAMKEMWRTIQGFEAYAVSDSGRVRRDTPGRGTWAGRVLKPRTNKKGYLAVNLTTNGEQHTKPVHRLVARAFLGSPSAWRSHVNHIDGVKTNNSKRNLEWCTEAENKAHAAGMGLMARGNRHSGVKVLDEAVPLMRCLWASGDWTSAEIRKLWRVGASSVSQICAHKARVHILNGPHRA